MVKFNNPAGMLEDAKDSLLSAILEMYFLQGQIKSKQIDRMYSVSADHIKRKYEEFFGRYEEHSNLDVNNLDLSSMLDHVLTCHGNLLSLLDSSLLDKDFYSPKSKKDTFNIDRLITNEEKLLTLATEIACMMGSKCEMSGDGIEEAKRQLRKLHQCYCGTSKETEIASMASNLIERYKKVIYEDAKKRIDARNERDFEELMSNLSGE